MSTIASGAVTLADVAKRLDPKGGIAKIVELLSKTNELLGDMLWLEGNLTAGHRVTVRTGLPTVYWRLLNQGVAKSKSTTAQIDEATAMLEARSEIDKEIAMLNGNTKEFRLSEAQAYIEAMNQEMASTVFYGNSATNPEEFNGLATRYSDPSDAEYGNWVIDAGATGSDNTSIWLVVWGENTIHGIYPKGSQAGLIHEDLGEVDAFDESMRRFRAFADWWQWKCGLAVKDYRYAVRIGSIDVSDLKAKSVDIVEYMIKAVNQIPFLGMGRAAFYMNKDVIGMLDILRRDDVITGGGLTYDVVDGKRMRSFQGIPIRRCDALHNAEEKV